MKKTAKLISLLLSALLVLTAMPISAFAEGEAAEKTNLALGKSYTKSVESDMGGGYVDSNGTELTDGVVGPADVSAGEWTVISQAFDVVVDLGANCVFDTFEVVVPTYLNTIALMPMNVAIAYGDTADGEFTEVYNGAIADPGSSIVETLTVTPGEEYTAQFVKFSFSGGAAGWNPVGELRVFGTELVEEPSDEPTEPSDEPTEPSDEPAEPSTKINFALGKTYEKSVAPSASGDYMDAIRTDTNDAELTDGIVPPADYWSEYGWVHWIGAGVDIIVDLEETTTFDEAEIVLLTRVMGNGVDMAILPANVKIAISDDKSVWTEVDNATLPEAGATAEAYTHNFTSDKELSARYVKFTLPDGYWNLVGEIRVIGEYKEADLGEPDISETGNLALNKTYKKSVAPTAGGDYMDAVRTDTDDAELTNGVIPAPDYWNEAGWVHWIGSAPEITVDLGGYKGFDTFEVTALSHFSADGFILPANVKISVSADELAWEEIDTVAFPTNAEVTTPTAYTLTYALEENVAGQYVKFSFPAGWNLIGELKVINTKVGDPEVPVVDEEGNVALGKKYEKSVAPSAGGDYMDAIRMDTDDAELTDGIVPPADYWNEYGWVHWIGKGVEITVDLGNRHVFDEAQIVLLTRVTGNGMDMAILPANVKIAISDDQATWNEIDDATLPEAGATAEAYVHSYKSEEKLTARYVKFTLPEGYWNLVSEISVINNGEEVEEPSEEPSEPSVEPSEPSEEPSEPSEEPSEDPTEPRINFALDKSYTKSAAPMANNYDDTNGTELTDGVVGSADVTAWEWVVASTAWDVVVDLGKARTFDTFEVVVPTYLNTIALMPMNVVVAYGDTADGEFTEVYNGAIADPGSSIVETLTVTPGEEYTAQFVKFSFSGGAAGWNPVGEIRVIGDNPSYVPDEPVVETYTVAGALTKSGSTAAATIELIADGETVASTTVEGKTGDYAFENVAAGSYTLKVTKSKHAAREYTVEVVDADVTQDVQVWLYGDVTADGIVNNTDVIQINRKNANQSSVFSQVNADSDYRLIVANVTAITGVDTIVNNTDVIQINRKNANQTSVFDRLA